MFVSLIRCMTLIISKMKSSRWEFGTKHNNNNFHQKQKHGNNLLQPKHRRQSGCIWVQCEINQQRHFLHGMVIKNVYQYFVPMCYFINTSNPVSKYTLLSFHANFDIGCSMLRPLDLLILLYFATTSILWF